MIVIVNCFILYINIHCCLTNLLRPLREVSDHRETPDMRRLREVGMRGEQNVHTTSRLFISHSNPHKVFATRRLSGATASRRLPPLGRGNNVFMSQISKQAEATILQQDANQSPFFFIRQQ